jgi:hypothetical protein
MLVAYLSTVAGFPVFGSSKKHGSHPFPCQEHDCGCTSAEECWTQCCCFTPEQHLAWAKEHAVEPPTYAVLPAFGESEPAHADHECIHCDEAKGHAATPCDVWAEHSDESRGSCIVGRESFNSRFPSVTAEQKQDPTGCCQQRPDAVGEDVQVKATKGVRWMLTMNALGCRGFSTQWVASCSVAPPPPTLTWQPLWQPAGDLCFRDLDISFRQTPPLDPPPRLVDSL